MYDDFINQLESKGVNSRWIKGIVIHIADILDAGKHGYVNNIHDYLQTLAFSSDPPFKDYSVHYKILEPHNNHEILICVWIEEE